MFKNAYVLLIMTALSFFTGCQNPDNLSPKEKPMRLAMKTDPRAFDPRQAGDRRSQTVINMLFEGLTRVAPDGQPQPAVASEISLSADKKTYTFKLRDEACWSDGAPVLAYDFEYAWKSILSPSSEFLFSEILYPIRNAQEAKMGQVPLEEVGVRAIDPKTLVVDLAYPAPYFLALIANGLFAPVPHKLDQEMPDWHRHLSTFVSNGPFCLAQYKAGEMLLLEKNPSYSDKNSVSLKSIHISIINDSNTAFAYFEQGKLDWMGEPFAELTLDVTPKLAAQGDLQTQPTLAVFKYVLDTTRPPFNSKKMRLAFSYALDRKSICSQILTHAAEPGGSVLSPMTSLYEYPLHKDGAVKEAQKLFNEALDEMGITKDQLPPVIISYGMIEGQKALTQAVQQQWKQAFDISVEIQGYEWSSYLAEHAQGKFQVSGVTWYSVHPDPIFNLTCFRSCGKNGVNPSGWESPVYVKLLDASNNEVDPSKRRSLLAQAEAYIMEEAPNLPVYNAYYRYVKSNRVKGVYIRDTGYIDFKWASVETP